MQKLGKDFEGQIHIIQLKNHNHTPPHAHQYLELVYIEAGSATHEINGTVSTIGAGDYFVVDYETTHSYVSDKHDLHIINCLFLPEAIDPAFAGVKSFNELIQRYFFRITGRTVLAPTANHIFHDTGVVGDLFRRMAEELATQKDGYLECARYLLCQIMIETVRQVGSIDRPSELIRTVIAQIAARYAEPITLQELCQAAHYSLPYISARFKAEVGISFTEYLQNHRIDHACRLLCETDRSIADIASAVGYGNLKFFRRLFFKNTGVTPREFRKRSGF